MNVLPECVEFFRIVFRLYNIMRIFSLIGSALAGKYPDKVLNYISEHDGTDRILWEYFVKHTTEVIYGVPSFTTYLTAAIGTWTTPQGINEVIFAALLNRWMSAPTSTTCVFASPLFSQTSINYTGFDTLRFKPK